MVAEIPALCRSFIVRPCLTMRASGLRSVGRLCRSLVYAQLLGAALRVSSARVVTSDQSGRFMSHPNRGAMAKEPELSSVPQIIHQARRCSYSLNKLL